jgi:polyvinyl alcohol dehydrogenase (cytochrome)
MRRWRLFASAWLAAVLATGLPGAAGAGIAGTAAGATFVNWPQYLYSAGHSSDNTAATAITPANAASLTLAWQFSPGPTGFLSSPTVYDGVIYIGAKNGYFYAISEATGAVIWKRFIGVVPKLTCGRQGFTSTATIAPDPATGNPAIYVYGASGYLYAMNAADGTDVWPPALVAIPSTTVNDYYAWSSPLVTDGNIYVGISSQCDVPLVRAGLAEYSQASGAHEDTFWTTPPGTVGASIWSSPATDGQSIYVTTGNGDPGSDGYSVIQLSPSLAQEAIWTVPPAELGNDSDFGGSPGLWTANIGGMATPMVGACNKNGIFYAFSTSAISAGPVWMKQISRGGECDAAPLWDGTHLFLAGVKTMIKGVLFDGSLRKVNPATGNYIWQTGLTGKIIGTPGMDGAGVIAASSYGSRGGQNGLWLINAANGQILDTISYGTSSTFAQPVFADGYLFTASQGPLGLQAYTAGGAASPR